MMKGWSFLKIKDYPIQIIDGDRGTNYPTKDEFLQDGYCLFLNTGNVTLSGFNFDDKAFVTEDKHKKLRKGHLQRYDSVLTTRGTIGNVAFYGDSIPYDVVRINSGMLILRPDPSKLDPRFFYGLLRSSIFQQQADLFRYGAAQPQLPITTLKHIRLPLPPFPIQQKVAGILSAYDDLIENNLKRIKLLEEIAQITYADWFVRRRINGTLITDEKIQYVEMKELINDYKNGGWGKEEPEGKFNEEGYVIRGTDIPDILSGNFNSVPKRFHTQNNLETRTLVDGDIIMEMSNGNMGNVGRSLYYDDSFNDILGSKVMCASFCKMVRAKNIGYSYLVDAHIKYIHKNNQMLVYKSQGANGINNFQFEQMIEEEIMNVPKNKQTLNELILHFDCVYKNLSLLRKQIHFLKEARDILLPRLMTGIIDLKSYNSPKEFSEVKAA